jgi:hypothetical protein
VRARAAIVAAAKSQLGLSDPDVYWREVLPVTWKGPYPRHWCGAFALWCLRQAGVGLGIRWEVGKGFLYRLKRTTTPEPGDIGYVDQPFQHHFVVTEADRHTIGSVDGNQGTPGVQARSRAVGKHLYYSVASLLPIEAPDTEPAPPPSEPLPEAGFLRDGPYAVPGIQDKGE